MFISYQLNVGTEFELSPPDRIREHGYALSNDLHQQETLDRNERTYADYTNQIHDQISHLRDDCMNLIGIIFSIHALEEI